MWDSLHDRHLDWSVCIWALSENWSRAVWELKKWSVRESKHFNQRDYAYRAFTCLGSPLGAGLNSPECLAHNTVCCPICTKVCTPRWIAKAYVSISDRAMKLYFHYQFLNTKQERLESCVLNTETQQYLDMDWGSLPPWLLSFHSLEELSDMGSTTMVPPCEVSLCCPLASVLLPSPLGDPFLKSFFSSDGTLPPDPMLLISSTDAFLRAGDEEGREEMRWWHVSLHKGADPHFEYPLLEPRSSRGPR